MHTSAQQKSLLEAEPTQLELTTDEIEHKRITLKRGINVPPEILSEIFMKTIPGDSDTETPFTLGAVCRSWRELIWSSPRLWSRISFTTRHYSPTKIRLLREWLARSNGLQLSIRLKLHEPSAEEVGPIRKQICETMDIIARCAPQWQHIDFDRFVLSHSKLCTVPTHFPILVSMSVRGQTGLFWRRCGIHDTNQVFWDAPRLRCVHVDLMMEQYMILLLSGLTTYSQFGFSPNVSLKVIQGASHLTRCALVHGMMVLGGLWARLPKVTALHLRSLEIRCATSYNIQLAKMFLDKLTAPALRDLSVDMTGSESESPHPSLELFVSRSGCHLARLTMANLDLSMGVVVEWLAEMPSLSELVLKDNVGMAGTLKSLCVDPASRDVILPNLESLVYINASRCSPRNSTCALDFSTLAHVAASRWERCDRHASKVAQLKSILLELSVYGGKGPDREEAEAMARLRKLVAKGMSVQILGATTPM